jgi:methyl-accepting chemotaxis protein
MVTSSVPIYNGDKLLAVMSHDMVINVLQKQVLGFQVGQKGFAFLIDREGHVIAHRDYKPENIDKGATVNIKLDVADGAMAPVVNAMLTKPRDVAAYKDKSGEEWVVVFDRIPTTDWHLHVAAPPRIIQPGWTSPAR